MKATDFKSSVALAENGIKGWTMNLPCSQVTGHLRAEILMGSFPLLLFPCNRCMIHGLSFSDLHFYLTTFSLLLVSDSSGFLWGAKVRAGTAFVAQFTTDKAAVFGALTRMICNSTSIANATVDPGRLYTLFAEKAVLPFPAILGCARITVFTVLIFKRNIPLTQRAKSVPFFSRKGYFVGWNVGKYTHRRLFSTGLSMFIKCMVIIIYLVIQHGEAWKKLTNSGLKKVGENPENGHFLVTVILALTFFPQSD